MTAAPLTPGCIPAPGIYRDVPMETYRTLRALSVSTLLYGRRTMRRLKLQLDQPSEETSAATELGIAAHCGLLEPERYTREVLIADCINPKTHKPYGRDTDKWKLYVALHPGRLIVSPEEAEGIEAMRASIEENEEAAKLLFASGHCEASFVWVDPDTGILCKGRLDKLIPAVIASDLKTTDDASEDGFKRAIDKHDYHQKVAFYTDGIRVLTGQVMDIPLVALEKDGAYECAVWALEPDAVEQGRFENRGLLHQLANCLKTGEWPSHPQGVNQIALPKWRQIRGVRAMDPEYRP